MSSGAQALHLVLAAGLASMAAPALAADQSAHLPPMPTGPGATPMGHQDADRVGWDEARADWLAECRERLGGRGKVAGGVVGGWWRFGHRAATDLGIYYARLSYRYSHPHGIGNVFEQGSFTCFGLSNNHSTLSFPNRGKKINNSRRYGALPVGQIEFFFWEQRR